MSVERDGTAAAQRGKPGRHPIYLSALIFPGAGQFTQGRWIAGTVYVLGFGASFAAFMVCVLKIIFAFYSVGLDFNTYQTADVMNLPTQAAALWFWAGVGIYIVNLIDAYAAYRRQCRGWARGKWGTAELLSSAPSEEVR